MAWAGEADVGSFVKVELGRSLGRFVVSAVKDEKILWQKETDFSNLDAAKDKAASQLKLAQGKSLR